MAAGFGLLHGLGFAVDDIEFVRVGPRPGAPEGSFRDANGPLPALTFWHLEGGEGAGDVAAVDAVSHHNHVFVEGGARAAFDHRRLSRAQALDPTGERCGGVAEPNDDVRMSELGMDGSRKEEAELQERRVG